MKKTVLSLFVLFLATTLVFANSPKKLEKEVKKDDRYITVSNDNINRLYRASDLEWFSWKDEKQEKEIRTETAKNPNAR